MEFTKKELLKIYVAMSNACDYAHSIHTQVTPEFEEIMLKIKSELEK